MSKKTYLWIKGLDDVKKWFSSLPEWFESFKDVLKWVLIAVAGVIGLIVLGAIVSGIIKAVEASKRAKKARQYKERRKK